jgi:hypothetical protein
MQEETGEIDFALWILAIPELSFVSANGNLKSFANLEGTFSTM